jgi:hypothetical protein
MQIRNFVRVALMLMVTSNAGCSLSAWPLTQASGTSGAFAFSLVGFAQHEFSPASCDSGGQEMFLGADFRNTNSPLVVRFVIDPLNGGAVRIFDSSAPWDKSVVFTKRDCATFEYSLDSTGWRINHVDENRITLTVDCTERGGNTFRGTVSAPHCS